VLLTNGDPDESKEVSKVDLQLNGVHRAADCRVPCKQSWDELQDACRRRRIHCRDLHVNKHNFNDYEVEYLCDLKRGKVRPYTIEYVPLVVLGLFTHLMISCLLSYCRPDIKSFIGVCEYRNDHNTT